MYLSLISMWYAFVMNILFDKIRLSLVYYWVELLQWIARRIVDCYRLKRRPPVGWRNLVQQRLASVKLPVQCVSSSARQIYAYDRDCQRYPLSPVIIPWTICVWIIAKYIVNINWTDDNMVGFVCSAHSWKSHSLNIRNTSQNHLQATHF